MFYRKEIDGLRAMAVVPVVLFHAGSTVFSGGYAGVDVFFVISGFLITTIILEDLRQDRFSITYFYERRARRILPALALVASVTTALAVFVLSPTRLEEYGESLIATALFLANVYFWQTTDYFGTVAEELPLLHMWSLAVEEQFYIVFPLICLALWRFGRGRSSGLLYITFLCIGATSFVFAVLSAQSAPVANFYLPLSRAWELLAGSFVALFLRGQTPAKTRYGPWLAGLGLSLVVFALLGLDDTTLWPGRWTIAPVAGTALILAFSRAECPTGRLLGFAPFVGIGLLSYSIYLWHQPLFAFARITTQGNPSVYLMAPLALATVPLAWLSWWFVERPFRRPSGNGGYSSRVIFTSAVASIVALIALGSVPLVAPNLTERLYTAGLSDDMRARYDMKSEALDKTLFAQTGRSTVDPCRLRFTMVTTEAEEAFLQCTDNGARAVIVTGGSHGGDLFQALVSSSGTEVLFGIARGYCRPHRSLTGPAPHECPFDGVRDLVAAYPDRIAMVIYTQAGFTVFDAYRDVRSADGLQQELVDEVGDYLQSLARYVPVLAIGPKPMLGIDPEDLMIELPFPGQIAAAQDPGIADAFLAVDQAFIRTLSSSEVTFLPHASVIGIELPGEAIVDNRLTYRDEDHWSQFGAKVFGDRLVSKLNELGYRELLPLR